MRYIINFLRIENDNIPPIIPDIDAATSEINRGMSASRMINNVTMSAPVILADVQMLTCAKRLPLFLYRIAMSSAETAGSV